MLRKKKLLVISIVVAVILIISTVIGVTIYAQDGSASPTTTPAPSATNAEDAFIAKVASILGLDETTVKNAFTQAGQELRLDAIKARLDKMVAAGKITQDQATEYLQWVESMPDIPGLTDSRGGVGRCYGFNGGYHRGMGGGMKNFRQGIPSTSVPAVTPSATSSSY